MSEFIAPDASREAMAMQRAALAGDRPGVRFLVAQLSEAEARAQLRVHMHAYADLLEALARWCVPGASREDLADEIARMLLEQELGDGAR